MADDNWNDVEDNAYKSFVPESEKELEVWKDFALSASVNRTSNNGPGGYAARMTIRYRRLRNALLSQQHYRSRGPDET